MTMQMVAEFHHIPSPLVKTREMYFVRYSRQIDINTWVVVDVSLETIFRNPVITCQRKPSGCVIQALQDGLSLVNPTHLSSDIQAQTADHTQHLSIYRSSRLPAYN